MGLHVGDVVSQKGRICGAVVGDSWDSAAREFDQLEGHLRLPKYEAIIRATCTLAFSAPRESE